VASAEASRLGTRPDASPGPQFDAVDDETVTVRRVVSGTVRAGRLRPRLVQKAK